MLVLINVDRWSKCVTSGRIIILCTRSKEIGLLEEAIRLNVRFHQTFQHEGSKKNSSIGTVCKIKQSNSGFKLIRGYPSRSWNSGRKKWGGLLGDSWEFSAELPVYFALVIKFVIVFRRFDASVDGSDWPGRSKGLEGANHLSYRIKHRAISENAMSNLKEDTQKARSQKLLNELSLVEKMAVQKSCISCNVGFPVLVLLLRLISLFFESSWERRATAAA